MDAIAIEREYKNRDTIELSRETLGEAYDAKLKMFFDEYVWLIFEDLTCIRTILFVIRHLHEDEEIRYMLSGGGYFDVRGEEWHLT